MSILYILSRWSSHSNLFLLYDMTVIFHCFLWQEMTSNRILFVKELGAYDDLDVDDLLTLLSAEELEFVAIEVDTFVIYF